MQIKMDASEEASQQEVESSTEQDGEVEPSEEREELNGQREELEESIEELKGNMEGFGAQREGLIVQQEEQGAQREEPGGQREEPGAQREEPGAQREEPGAQREGSCRQREEPGRQREGPGRQREEPGRQREGPGRQREGPGRQRAEPGRQRAEPGGQREEPGRQREEPGRQREEPGRQRAEPGEQREEPGRQRAEPGEQREEPSRQREGPGRQREEPGGQREEPGRQRAEPGEQREEPIGQKEGPGRQREEPGEQREEPSGQREGPGRQREEPGGPREEPGRQRAEPGEQREEPSGQREGPSGQREGPGRQREEPGRQREEPGEVADDPVQESEITDLCSDTESAASLSLDGPLHSPPPLQSPTPPSSPDIPHFPHVDHFSEDHPSPPPTRDTPPRDSDRSDALPEDEDIEEDMEEDMDEEDVPPSFPQTYADFYSQSHQKSYPESRPHPNSFPEPLRTAYPVEPPQGRADHAPRSSHHALQQRPVRKLPLDSSIGCRLHHYDGQSDGESGDRSPVPRGRRRGQRGDVPARRASAGHKRSAPGVSPGSSEDRTLGAPEDKTPGEAGPKGDAISLAIRGIKEAIEEVKTRAVRSPYTPDQPVEPVWVMRQEGSPTEEASSMGQASPGSPDCPLYPSSVQESISSRTFPQRQSSAPNPGQQRAPAAQHPPQPHPPQPHLSQPPVQVRQAPPSFPTFVDVPGPCDPDDLIDGIIFAATYLGCTHLLSERTPSKSARMQQAQDAMGRVRAAQKQAKNRKKGGDSDSVSTVEVDLFMSTQRIKVLNADTQESLMDLPLRTISYIADIGNMVVLMARGKMVRSRSAPDQQDQQDQQEQQEQQEQQGPLEQSPEQHRVYRMICHVFESEDAQLIAQSIGQSFSVAYQEFLRANGIDPQDLSQREYSDLLSTQDMYNDDLVHFSKSENCRDVYIEKQKGEVLGVVIVESGWGSILPTVIIASMMHSGPAEKSGRLNIGDQIMTINGTSLVGLPLSTCQSIIKGLKSQCRIKMNIVRCPPVTMVLIRRPDLRYQLGFSVQNGIICSLMRGGIAERGGVRVGHRIIEINGQSVVATPHEKIVQILSNAMGEIHMKTMPAAMYRLLTAQEQPVYI